MEKINFQYETKASSKARRVSITVYPDLRVVVTKPYRMPEFIARNFAMRKKSWVEKRLKFYAASDIKKLGTDRSKTRTEALEFVKSRLGILNEHYNFKIGRVSIKDHKSLWGSCSRRGNLNFNHKIVELTQQQADYIIAHELCHLKEFNHSKKFWDLVSETIPNYLTIRKELKRYSFQ